MLAKVFMNVPVEPLSKVVKACCLSISGLLCEAELAMQDLVGLWSTLTQHKATNTHADVLGRIHLSMEKHHKL